MSASLISLIVTILFVVLLAAGFLVGLWRGLRKSLISSVCSIVGVLLAFFLTPVIAGSVLGLNITINDEVVALRDLALHLAKDNPDFALLIETNDGFRQLLSNMPAAIVNALLLILVTILIEILVYFIYLIFAKFVFKKKILEKKHRLAGAGIGLAKMFIVVLIAFMPLAGLIGTASYIVGQPSSAQAQETTIDDSRLFEKDIPNTVKEVASGLENNLLTKICGVFGMDNAMFDYYGTIEVNGEDVKFREEIINTYDTADSIYQVTKVINGNGSLANINFNALSDALDKTLNGNLFKQIVCPALGDVIINSDKYDFAKSLAEAYPDAFAYIKNGLEAEVEQGGSYHSYFASDFNKVFTVVRSVAESGLIDSFSSQDGGLKTFLETEGNLDLVKSDIKQIFDVELVRAFASNAVEMLVQSIPVLEGKEVVSTLAWTDDDWKGVAANFCAVVDNLDAVLGQLESQNDDIIEVLLTPSEETNVETIVTNVGQAVDNLRENELLQTEESESLLDCILTDETVDITLPTENLIKNDGTEVSITNYQELLAFMLPAIQEVRNSELYATIKSAQDANAIISAIAGKLSQEGNENLLKNAMLPLVQIEKTKTLIVDMISPESADALIDLSGLSTYDQWNQELGYVGDMLVALQTTEVESSAGNSTALSLVLNGDMTSLINQLTGDDIESIFKPLLWAESTTSLKTTLVEKMKEEIENIIEAGENKITMSTDGITFKQGAAEDQTEEFVNIVKDLVQIAKTYNPDTGIDGVDKTLLGGMLDKMKANANRTNSGKTEAGIFGGENGAFVRICDYAKQEYYVEIMGIPTVLQYATILGLSAEDQARYQSYYDNMTQETYQNINFTQMLADFAIITELKNQIPSGI